jgi:sialate O-acetylesterase
MGVPFEHFHNSLVSSSFAETSIHSFPSQIKMKAAVLLALSLFLTTSAHALVRLASPFTDHMVLQCDMKVPVWGTAEPGEHVFVQFDGQKVVTDAGADGKWRVDLQPMKASSESRVLTVGGSKTGPLEFQDVLVGEVWIASGQSNMEFSMSKKVKSFAGVANEAEEIAAANYPLIRMFTGAGTKTYAPQETVKGEWKVCTPENAPAFSAVGYFFARDLQRDLKIPVGIINESFGASTAESWIRRETMAADPKLKPMLDRFDEAVEHFRTNPPPTVAAPRSEDVSATNAVAANTGTNGSSRRVRGSRAPRDPVQDQHNATVLFNGMIAPIAPYAIRGAIWYQGESIVGGEAGIALYPHVQATLVRDWRKLWGEGDFPFLIVQLAGQEATSNSPRVREAQATILALPNTSMAVATDIGEAKNVHPKNKQDVGDRLSRIALAKTYGRKIEFSGPAYESMKIEGSAIRVNFSHAEGLVARDGTLKWFTIAGADGKFVPADAKIDGQTVIVSSPDVSAPVAVRYAWVNFPNGGHLYNSAGLPAAQFRSDAPKGDLTN